MGIFLKKLEVPGNDELSRIFQAINLTTDNLQSSRDALEKCLDELFLAKEEYEKASRAKNVFLANMSHELRIQHKLSLQNEKLRKKAEKKALIQELQELINNVKVLRGFLPICASCKKILSDQGYWEHLEVYIESHTDAVFSHGICPDCSDKL